MVSTLAPPALPVPRPSLALQLSSQRFAPPRGAPSPPPGSALAKAADLGLKLTAGAEILCARFGGRPGAKPQGQEQQAQQQGGDAGPAVGAVAADGGPAVVEAGGAAAGVEVVADGGLREADVATDPAWGRFKRSLQGSGYFGGNIPGSKR